jgi:hypothetical protein
VKIWVAGKYGATETPYIVTRSLSRAIMLQEQMNTVPGTIRESGYRFVWELRFLDGEAVDLLLTTTVDGRTLYIHGYADLDDDVDLEDEQQP